MITKETIRYNGIPFAQVNLIEPRFNETFSLFLNHQKRVVFFSGLFSHQVLTLFWNYIEFDQSSIGEELRGMLGEKAERHNNIFNNRGLDERGYFDAKELAVVATTLRYLMKGKHKELEEQKSVATQSSISDQIIIMEQMVSRIIVAISVLNVLS